MEPDRLAFFISCIDGTRDGPPPAPVCPKCLSTFFCTCSLVDVPYRRGASPPPPTPVMLEVLRQSRSLSKRSLRKRSRSSRKQQAKQEFTKAAMRPLPTGSCSPLRQATWEEVATLLDDNTLSLQRTRSMFEKLFEDMNMTVHLPNSDDYIQHGISVVVDNFSGSQRFKIGMTIDPAKRFYQHPCAYVRHAIQAKDRANWSSMTIIYCDYCQRAAAMLEHALIKHFKLYNANHCSNRRTDFDHYSRFDDHGSDGEAEEGPGPWFVYIVTGSIM